MFIEEIITERKVVMSKKALLFVCFALLASLLCGCQIQSAQSGESTPAAEGSTISPWKTAYLEYLEAQKDDHLSYALIYIDDDDIPELYLSGNCEATGDSVCSYKNGTVIEQLLNRIGGGKYIEKSGEIINQNGNMGQIYTHVYKLTEHGFVLTFHALSSEHAEYLGHDEYSISYEYSVENKPVNESDYTAAVDAAFNFAQSVPLNENAVEYDAITQQIMDWESNGGK